MEIVVEEFEEVPVLCKKSYPGILRDGACYVRRRGRIESTEVPNSAEMRGLADSSSIMAPMGWTGLRTRRGGCQRRRFHRRASS